MVKHRDRITIRLRRKPSRRVHETVHMSLENGISKSKKFRSFATTAIASFRWGSRDLTWCSCKCLGWRGLLGPSELSVQTDDVRLLPKAVSGYHFLWLGKTQEDECRNVSSRQTETQNLIFPDLRAIYVLTFSHLSSERSFKSRWKRLRNLQYLIKT